MTIYFKTLPFLQITDLESDAFETLWVKIKVQKNYLTYMLLVPPHHTPTAKQEEFLDYISDTLSEAQQYIPDLISLVDDCNAGNCWPPEDASKHSSVTSFERRLKNTTETLVLTQLINTATRIQNGTHNIIDVAFVNRPDLIKEATTAPPFSKLDHLPLLITLSLSTLEDHKCPTTTVWDYANTNIDELIQTLTETNWNAIADHSVEEVIELLTTTLLNAAKNAFQQKH